MNGCASDVLRPAIALAGGLKVRAIPALRLRGIESQETSRLKTDNRLLDWGMISRFRGTNANGHRWVRLWIG